MDNEKSGSPLGHVIIAVLGLVICVVAVTKGLGASAPMQWLSAGAFIFGMLVIFGSLAQAADLQANQRRH